MFRHKEGENNKEEIEKKEEKTEPAEEKEERSAQHAPQKGTGDFDIKELLEKNLKWSQIIYEQNRKLNRKLVWAAVASWFRLFVILVPLLLALWFLPPFIRQLTETYSGLFNLVPTANTPANIANQSAESVESLLKVLPITDAQKAQLRGMMK